MKRDDMLSALAVSALLIGTATGSATALMVISAVLLAVLAMFRRKSIRSGAVSVLLIAAITAIIVASCMALKGP